MALTYTADGITVTYLGRTTWAECDLPRQSEVQWGLDSLTRTFTGAAPLLEAFVQAINKGNSYTYAGSTYYLIDWSVGGTKVWPELTANYLGQSSGTPPPVGDDSWSPQTITISATVPSDDPDAEDGATMTVERTIDYIAYQTTWRYIRTARPTAAEVGHPAGAFFPIILRSVITTSTGHTYAGQNAPAGLVSATTPAVVDIVLSLDATEIYATPFFEITETVARMFYG